MENNSINNMGETIEIKKEVEDFELNEDCDSLLAHIKEYWLPLLRDRVSIDGDYGFYVKRVDNHLEIGIAKVDYIK